MECWQRRAAPPWAVSPCGERRGLSCGLEGGAGVQQGSGGLTEALESRVLRAVLCWRSDVWPPQGGKVVLEPG